MVLDTVGRRDMALNLRRDGTCLVRSSANVDVAHNLEDIYQILASGRYPFEYCLRSRTHSNAENGPYIEVVDVAYFEHILRILFSVNNLSRKVEVHDILSFSFVLHSILP